MQLSDSVLIALIGAGASTVASVIAAIVSLRNGARLARTDKKVEAVAIDMNTVKVQTNGMTDKLVAATAKSAYAAGEQRRRLTDKDSDLGTLS